MAFDNRSNLQIPKISAEDTKDPAKLAVLLNLIGDRLNAVKSPRFIVRRIDSYRTNTVVRIDDVGFNIGSVVFGGIFRQAGGAQVVNMPSANPIFIDNLNITGGSCQFTLDGGFQGSETQIYSFTIIIFELDANNNQGATTSSDLANLFMRR